MIFCGYNPGLNSPLLLGVVEQHSHSPWKTMVIQHEQGFFVAVRVHKDRASHLSIHADEDWVIASVGDLNTSIDDCVRFIQDGKWELVCKDNPSACFAVVDLKQASLRFMADWLGTLPHVYVQHGDAFTVGPDAKSTSALCSLPLDMSPEQGLLFLMNRYLPGENSMFEGVKRIGPGESVSFHARSGSLRKQKIRPFEYTSDLQDRSKAESALYDVLEASHKDMCKRMGEDTPSRIFLTGGMDSRGVAAFLDRIGKPPTCAVTWGNRQDLPGSDPQVSAEIAEKYRIPHQYLQVNAEGYSIHRDDWIITGELSSDNSNNYALPGNQFSREDENPYSYSIIGDEAFGAGPMPVSDSQVVDHVFSAELLTLENVLPEFLHPAGVSRTRDSFHATVKTALAGCLSSELKDRQDYLFYHTYIARWILAAGMFKHPVLDVRRPLMTPEVMKIVLRLPPVYRVDKTMYLNMLRRFFPDLFRIRRVNANSAVDWGLAARAEGSVRAYLQKQTTRDALEALPIREWLDIERTEAYLNLYFADMENSPPEQTHIPRTLYSWRRKLSGTPLGAKIIGQVQPLVMKSLGLEKQKSIRGKHQVIYRLALLSRMRELLDEGRFQPGAASRSHWIEKTHRLKTCRVWVTSADGEDMYA